MLQSLAKQSLAKMLQSSAEKCCKVRPGNCCKIRPRKVQPRKVRLRKVRPRKFIAKYGREMLQKSAEKCAKNRPENVPKIGRKMLQIRTWMSPKHQCKASTFQGMPRIDLLQGPSRTTWCAIIVLTLIRSFNLFGMPRRSIGTTWCAVVLTSMTIGTTWTLWSIGQAFTFKGCLGKCRLRGFNLFQGGRSIEELLRRSGPHCAHCSLDADRQGFTENDLNRQISTKKSF